MIALLQPDLIDGQQELVPDRFLKLLPQIRRQASVAFRHHRAEARQELIEEVIARAYCAWVRLVQLGKEAVAYATPLAQFAIRRVREGRQVGGGHSVNDVMSLVASRTRGFKVTSLDQHDRSNGNLNQLLVEDRQAGPAETAAARIDVAAWFRTLSKRHRQIAKALALGEPTSAVAKQFGLSAWRISQLRLWFREHWERFQGAGQVATVAG